MNRGERKTGEPALGSGSEILVKGGTRNKSEVILYYGWGKLMDL